MIYKKLVAIIFIVVHTCCAGFKYENFFFYRLSYKNAWYQTRHKDYLIPIFDEGYATAYLKHKYINDVPTAGTLSSLRDGKEWIAISTPDAVARCIWFNKTNGTYDYRNILINDPKSFPSFRKITSLHSDQYGNFLAQGDGDIKIASGHIDVTSGKVTGWYTYNSDYEYVGASRISEESFNEIIALQKNGIVQVFDDNLKVISEFQGYEIEGFIPTIFKCDSKLNHDGNIDIWVYGFVQNEVDANLGGNQWKLIHVSYDPQARISTYKKFELTVPLSSIPPEGTFPLSQWSDFIPFWVGGDEQRIVALVNDQVHTFTTDGRWIEHAYGSIKNCNTLVTCVNIPQEGDLYNSTRLLTSNNRGNYKSNNVILVAEDFRNIGHGLKRLSYIPDGFDDHIQLDVKMKDNSSENENIARPILQIENLSMNKQLSDFKLRLWISREENSIDTILADKYWSQDDSLSVQTGCSSENPNLCWVDLLFSKNFTIDPGMKTAEDAVKIGVHSSQWGNWDRSNDPSWENITNIQSRLNSNIAVYTHSNFNSEWKLAWGNVPLATSIPLPFGWVAGPPVADRTASSILNYNINDAWGCNSAGSLQIKTSINSPGINRLEINGGGWLQIQSRPFAFNKNVKSLSFSFFYPNTELAKYWAGQIQVYIESKKNGIYGQMIGLRNFNNDDIGKVSNLHYDIPNWVKDRIAQGGNDLTIRFVLNTPLGIDGFGIYPINLQSE